MADIFTDAAGPVSLGELQTALVARVESFDQFPNHEAFARLRCWNENCSIREVDVLAHWPDGDRPKDLKFSCPGCQDQLELVGFLRDRTLVPVPHVDTTRSAGDIERP